MQKTFWFPDVVGFPKTYIFINNYIFKDMLNFIQNNNVNLVDITVSSYCTERLEWLAAKFTQIRRHTIIFCIRRFARYRDLFWF